MKKKRKALTLTVRQELITMRSAGLGIREIGRRLFINPSIVSRELRRNSGSCYVSARLTLLERAKEADDLARKRRKAKRRGKRKARPLVAVYEHIAAKLQLAWSPECISAKFRQTFAGQSLSTSTIYRMIKRDWSELIKYLPERGKKRRLRATNRRGRFQQGAVPKKHKEQRSIMAEKRLELGHLEGDCILSSRGSKAAVLSIIDRMTGVRWYEKIANLEAKTIRETLVKVLHAMPAYAKRSCTLDNGSEFAEWAMLEKIFPGFYVYFCTAYSPHEKGSVERSNRDLRRLFPKGTDFATVSNAELQRCQEIFNNKPLKRLGFITPNEFYQQQEMFELQKMAA